MAVYKVQISSAGSPDVVSLADGSTYATLEVSAGRGPKGDGWTAVTYDNNTGRFTFTSNDGLGYVSDSITGDLDTAVTEAEAAQAAAEAAQAATENIFDQFGDQYLGPKASDPTVDNDGDPLTEGDIYFNTTDDVLKFYSGTAWVAPESIATTAAAASETASAASAASAAAASASETASAASASAASTSEANAATSASSAAASASEAAASAASINPDSIDINGGTIDGTVIGGSTPAAGSFTTGSFTGDVSFGDNDKAIFGAGSDLQIYHDGGNSYIQDVGTGNLFIDAQDLRMRGANGDIYATFIQDGAVTAYHNGSAKLATTSTGIDVTGTVTADGLTVQTVQGNIEIANSSAVIDMQRSGTNYIYASDASGNLRLGSGGLFNRINIANSGDISFYEDTGTTPKFFWDASAESLGIGTSSPSATLDVNGTIKLDGNYPVGPDNVALGNAALDDASLTGGSNTAIGGAALTSNTSGYYNTAVGHTALQNNTTGQTNTAVGYAALDFNVSGQSNTAQGFRALRRNTGGSYNTAVGLDALFSNTASNNTAVGYLAGYENTTGTLQTFIGYQAGNAVTTGSKNTILGAYSGNQGGLDIRTSNNNIVLSDGDGNPRLHIDSSGNLEMTGGGSVGWANWTITESGGSLYFATGGTNKMKLDASGNLQVVGNVESNATIT